MQWRLSGDFEGKSSSFKSHGSCFRTFWAKICTFAATIKSKTNCACFLSFELNGHTDQKDVRLNQITIDIIIVVHSESIAKSKPEIILENDAFASLNTHTHSSGIMSYLRSAGIFFVSFCVSVCVCFSRLIRFFGSVFLDFFYIWTAAEAEAESEVLSAMVVHIR